MKDVQAILREIVNDLEKTAAGFSILAADVQKLCPHSGYEMRDLMDIAYQNNRQFYDGLRTKIENLT
jgi:hypothetical protein